MDVLLIQAPLFDLPSSRRVDAIVYDGSADLRPWPGAPTDRDLIEAYGPELSSVLERERERIEGEALALGEMIRLHRGRLHANFLLWIATRPPDNAGIPAPAPSATTLERAVKEALAFVAERNVVRVAFGAMGHGPGALDEVERLVLVARAANAYHETRFREGRPSVVEEVLICDSSSSRVAAARRALGGAVRAVAPPAPAAKKAAPRPAAKRSTTSRAKKGPPPLDEHEIARARGAAEPYDRARTYAEGDWFVHAKFGVGKVEQLTPEGFIMVRFEGGDSRRLLHGRG